MQTKAGRPPCVSGFSALLRPVGQHQGRDESGRRQHKQEAKFNMATQRANPLADPIADAEAPPAAPLPAARPSLYLELLNWAFALFSSTRFFTYLPTLFAIHHSGDSSQHSLWTWFAWVGSNAAMAAWLHENNARRINKAILVRSAMR